MLIDQIRHAGAYTGMGPGLAQAFAFLASAPLATLALGRHEITGDRVFALVQDYLTKPPDAGVWEAHRRYIDVQYVVLGTERLGYAPLDRLTVTQPYDEAKDVVLLAGEGDRVTAAAGTFVVFFPHDAHMPGLALGEPAPVRKVVVKVAV
jgi:YhcH/YjgK/YiaL family protein